MGTRFLFHATKSIFSAIFSIASYLSFLLRTLSRMPKSRFRKGVEDRQDKKIRGA